MRTHIIERKIDDYASLLGLKYGWGNGYVLLDKEHPWFGMDYDMIPVDVHGGVTFAQEISEKDFRWDKTLIKEDIGKYMIGFDTTHYGDTLDDWGKEEVIKETQRLFKQCLSIYNNTIYE